MDIPHLLAHPDELNQETLYDLRRIVGVHPTYHAARILLLQNLFLLHDTTFDQELRRAALLVPDRRVLCNITQFGGLQPMLDRAQQPAHSATPAPTAQGTAEATAAASEPTTAAEETEAAVYETPASDSPTAPRRPRKKYVSDDTTLTLLDNFLGSTPTPLQRRRIKADPATDYMAYLTQADEADGADSESLSSTQTTSDTPSADNSHRMDELINGFITSYQNGIQLSENPSVPDYILIDSDESPLTDHNDAPEAVPSPKEDLKATALTETSVSSSRASEVSTSDPSPEAPTAALSAGPSPATDAGLTETLANIYIKQQKYDRALEVMTKIQASASNSNPYLADQVRFLQKLAINSRHKR